MEISEKQTELDGPSLRDSGGRKSSFSPCPFIVFLTISKQRALGVGWAGAGHSYTSSLGICQPCPLVLLGLSAPDGIIDGGLLGSPSGPPPLGAFPPFYWNSPFSG